MAILPVSRPPKGEQKNTNQNFPTLTSGCLFGCGICHDLGMTVTGSERKMNEKVLQSRLFCSGLTWKFVFNFFHDACCGVVVSRIFFYGDGLRSQHRHGALCDDEDVVHVGLDRGESRRY